VGGDRRAGFFAEEGGRKNSAAAVWPVVWRRSNSASLSSCYLWRKSGHSSLNVKKKKKHLVPFRSVIERLLCVPAGWRGMSRRLMAADAYASLRWRLYRKHASGVYR